MTISKTTKHFLYGLLLRLILLIALPALMDDGLLLPGVRYTDIDYDVFTDAAAHVAEGRSPYRRHTYRYTPFLAALLSLPMGGGGGRQFERISLIWSVVLSTKYFGKILFCMADAICGYIILILRARSRKQRSSNNGVQDDQPKQHNSIIEKYISQHINLSSEFIDALWWLYNPLPINICTRGSAEALVVLLPVLLTVALTVNDNGMKQLFTSLQTKTKRSMSIPLRACLAGILHGIGIHCKLYPVIYTVSFMANFSRQEQQQRRRCQSVSSNDNHTNSSNDASSSTIQQQLDQGWTHTLSEQMTYFQNCMCCTPQSSSGGGFPWKHPIKILMLALLWIQRLFLTPSSILFLLSSIATMAGTTYAAIHYYGHEALAEGLLYHFGRIDHRHNYSMYWYWIYLLRGRVASAEVVAPSTWVGNVPLIPQILSEWLHIIICF